MEDKGEHGIRMGGLTGVLGAGAALVGGQLAEDGEEAFEEVESAGVRLPAMPGGFFQVSRRLVMAFLWKARA
ncbi:hypothetical protein [Acidithiobacillus caldus]|uniref:hypothetical protein n=1 Tax=Acidithiobacillus caldus TaxID=33059 RepID=UPI001F5298D4|nr:hypothetical protein [Acidithiobacillus caldus]